MQGPVDGAAPRVAHDRPHVGAGRCADPRTRGVIRERVKRIASGAAVAVAFFALLEGVLYLAGVVPLYERADPYVGFAGYSPLFVERQTAPGQPVLETAPGKLRWFNRQQFPARKAAGVTRVFCLGGSTTYGRPYDDRTSFCGWLRAFLPSVDPHRRWEVVNAGGISYASYRVVRLMEQLSDHEPDLFIVYTGHNEFLEERTYGRMLDTPEVVRDLASLASRLRVYSAMADVAYDRGDVLSADVDAVLDRSVGPEDYHRDDALRDAVLEHFRVSLDRMTRIADRAGAGLIFVTPASNIGDFSPFKSEPAEGLMDAGIEQVRRLREEAAAALEAGDPSAALRTVETALAIDPRDPESLYLDGRVLRALGRPEEARRAFIAARDEDVAPLRALSPMPRIVAEVARDRGAGLVDFAALVKERSPDGIPGSGLFLDHVHPTIEGNRLLALALVDAMVDRRVATPAPTWNGEAVAAVTERVEAGVDEAAHALARRSLANVLIWAGKHEEAAGLVDESAVETPENAETLFQKATLLTRDGRRDEALPYYREAARLAPADAAIRKGYGVLLSELGRKAEARTELESAARLDPALVGVHYELGVVLGDLGEDARAEGAYRAALERDPSNADAWNNLGVILAVRGDIAGAAQYFGRALEADPAHPDAAGNLAMARDALRR